MSSGKINRSCSGASVPPRLRCFYRCIVAVIVLIIVFVAVYSGCCSGDKNMSPDWSKNTDVLKRTDSLPGMEQNSELEKSALKLFADFYAEYSTKSITAGVRSVYADDAWFGDPFQIVEGIDEIEHYFLAMAEPVEECVFDVTSWQRCNNDYYIRWTMTLVSKAAKKERIETIGISHVRYNKEGKIVFQQDYWDTGAMFERMPIVGFWTRFAKKRLEKRLEK